MHFLQGCEKQNVTGHVRDQAYALYAALVPSVVSQIAEKIFDSIRNLHESQ